MADAPFEWDLELPGKASRTGFGAGRPRAYLCVDSETHGSEKIALPVAVERALEAKRRAGESLGSSRAELLWQVRELSASCAHAKAEDLVNRRDYSRAELVQKLSQDGYSQRVVDELVGRLERAGVLDDARFAGAFVRSKLLCGWGKIKIEQELRRRGVEVAQVPGWPEEFFDADDERGRALALASRRRLTGKNDLQKIVRFLCSRGFGMSLAIDVAHEVLDASQDQDDR